MYSKLRLLPVIYGSFSLAVSLLDNVFCLICRGFQQLTKHNTAICKIDECCQNSTWWRDQLLRNPVQIQKTYRIAHIWLRTDISIGFERSVGWRIFILPKFHTVPFKESLGLSTSSLNYLMKLLIKSFFCVKNFLSFHHVFWLLVGVHGCTLQVFCLSYIVAVKSSVTVQYVVGGSCLFF